MEVYDFGLRLRELRKKKNLTQEQVANRLEISKSAISRYERNLLSPSVQIIKRFAILYGSSVDYIMGIDDREMLSLDNLTQNQIIILNSLVLEFQDENNQ